MRRAQSGAALVEKVADEALERARTVGVARYFQQRDEQSGVDIKARAPAQSEPCAEQDRPAHGPTEVGRIVGPLLVFRPVLLARVGPEHIEHAGDPAAEVGALGENELLLDLLVAGRRTEMVPVRARAAGENEHAFPDGMGELAVEEFPVLHRREKRP